MPDMSKIPTSGQMILKDAIGFEIMDMLWDRGFVSSFNAEDLGVFVVVDAVYNMWFKDFLSANVFTGQFEDNPNEPVEKAVQRGFGVYLPYAFVQQTFMKKKSWTYMKATQYAIGSGLIQVVATDMIIDKIIINTKPTANGS